MSDQTNTPTNEQSEVTIPAQQDDKIPVYTGDEDFAAASEKPAEAKVENAASDEPDWKAKYEEEKSRYEELSQYEAIIDRMKQDEALVDVLEAHIRGEIPGARAASANDSNSDDDFWRDVDETEAAGYQAPKPPEQKLYTKEEVEAEKARAAAAAEVKKELDNVLRYLGENGVPESVQNEFIAFVGNPSGVTGMDLLNVFKTVKERAGAPIEIKQQDEKHGGSIMDVAGKSDKPDPNRYLSQEDAVASNYKADPNNL